MIHFDVCQWCDILIAKDTDVAEDVWGHVWDFDKESDLAAFERWTTRYHPASVDPTASSWQSSAR